MEPLSWVTIANLMLKYVPEVVTRIVENAQNNVPVTPEEWAKVKKCIPFDDLVPKRTDP